MLLSIVFIVGVLKGLALGYILWAPDSNFKQGFMDGLILKFIWGKK